MGGKSGLEVVVNMMNGSIDAQWSHAYLTLIYKGIRFCIRLPAVEKNINTGARPRSVQDYPRIPPNITESPLRLKGNATCALQEDGEKGFALLITGLSVQPPNPKAFADSDSRVEN